jgi:DtxR family Mn-dependent transcriptional regulator
MGLISISGYRLPDFFLFIYFPLPTYIFIYGAINLDMSKIIFLSPKFYYLCGMSNSFTEENYLKAIFKLSHGDSAKVSTNSIAAQVNTKAATVTDMLKKLADKKLIIYNRYQGVSLSATGKKIALNIVRKHRLWEVFLVEKLNFKWDEVHDIAEQLEHVKSDTLVDELDKFLGNPKFDPHGDPIPDRNGKMNSVKPMPLADMKKGNYVFAGVDDHSSAFLQFISKVGIQIGDKIQVNEIFGFDKSVEITVRKKKIFLGNESARNILVDKI